MNAVEAAEQLVTVGRRIQAAEQRLRRPIVALDTLAALGEQWVDPVARLAELIAPHVALQEAPRARPTASSAPLDRFDFQPTAPAAGTSAYARPFHRDKDLSPSAAGIAGRAEPAVTRALPVGSPGEGETAHSSAPTGVDAIRLTRNQSSLLSILRSNVQPGHQPGRGSTARLPSSSIPGEMGAHLADRTGNGLVDGDQLRPSGPPLLNLDALSTPGTPDPRATVDWAGHANNPAMTVRQAENPPMPAVPARADRGDASPARDVAPRIDRWPGAERASTEDGMRLADFTGEAYLLPPQPAGDALWFALPPADEALLDWGDSAGSTATLTPAQIDQILDALNERLEMMMLRMYGAI